MGGGGGLFLWVGHSFFFGGRGVVCLSIVCEYVCMHASVCVVSRNCMKKTYTASAIA